MRITRHITVVVLLALGLSAHAQHKPLMQKGKITFERKVNTYGVMPLVKQAINPVSEDDLATFMQNYRNTSPQFWTTNFELYFDASHSLYQPENPNLHSSNSFTVPAAYKNKVYSDFAAATSLTEKRVFEKTFFIKDSLKHIRWKITDEIREIAGYSCRRANGLLFDSIYVVAFYTDEILTKGGPESFNGLPGMILGVALPHDHITIFATGVDSVGATPSDWDLPKPGKGEAVNNHTFYAEAADILKAFRWNFGWIKLFLEI